MITGGVGGDQPGAGPAPVGSHIHPGAASEAAGTADQVGTERGGGLAAVERSSATGGPAWFVDQLGRFAVAGTKDWPDQPGMAVVQARPKASKQPRRAGVFRGMAAIAVRGGWRLPLVKPRCRRRGQEQLLVPPRVRGVRPRVPARQPREVGWGLQRVQRRRGGCLSPRALGSE